MYGPYTSKDLDYFGQREAAEKLAHALNGTLLIPHSDDHTPQTAIVQATIGEQDVEIDFLWHVKGVNTASLEKQAVEVRMHVRAGSRTGQMLIPIMHPLHCMQSRLANVVTLHRDTDLARRQLEASPIVLREYLFEALAAGGHRHVTSVLQGLADYLLSDPVGRKAHKVMKNDPAAVFAHFQDDDRLDERWREKSLGAVRQKIAERREAWHMMVLRRLFKGADAHEDKA
ncbi:hypothetical protein U5A82_02770 [Sphingobium sp. CR2-8]|uniref:hypothetical protein n=1 Tax=Sphingobium sp. CR2-8 TaxID=1306534 RepID=UPI002DBF1337|nr:hypothetical protein [Sphingobium sp. CR2-8]MEC3909432.1 hypothetical protein [Sphingobium sp. CR2-8]